MNYLTRIGLVRDQTERTSPVPRPAANASCGTTTDGSRSEVIEDIECACPLARRKYGCEDCRPKPDPDLRVQPFFWNVRAAVFKSRAGRIVRMHTIEGWRSADAFTCQTCGAQLLDVDAIEYHIRATAELARPHHAVYTAVSYERIIPAVEQAELTL